MPFPEALRNVARDLLDPEKVARAIEAGLLLVLIAIAAWASIFLVRRAGTRLSRRYPPGSLGPAASALGPILENIVRWVIVGTALILMLRIVFNFDVTTILASAGIAGVALGFGAQYLIRDILAGFFLYSEGTIQIGDLVRVDGDIGVVEHLSLRQTRIRKFSGELVAIQNGTISRIGNLSRDYGRAVVQVTVPYRADVGEALQALREAARAWAADHPQEAQGEPSLDGVVDLRDAGAVMQVSVLVRPGRQLTVEPELRKRALETLAGHGIEIEARLLRY